MPMHTSDTRLAHLDSLAKLGWLSFDVTHMGEPDGYLMTPCNAEGYRAVYGPRPKLSWQKANEGMRNNSDPSIPTDGRVERSWTWDDRYGADQASYFTREQRLGNEGSWVLVAGARQDGDGPPIDAQAKWWVTTQSDADTLEEELINLEPGATQQFWDGSKWRTFTGGYGDYLGRMVRYRHREHWHNIGGNFPSLRRWTKDNQNAGVEGLGAYRHESGYTYGGGIEDPGLGESSGLPHLAGGNRTGAGFDLDSIFWVKYGNRPFLGVVKCNDPIGAEQERDDHHTHGSGANWRGLGQDDFDVTGIVSPGASARGGYVPKILFFGGDIIGAQGEAITSDDGTITGINITDPGATVISDLQSSSIDPPNVTVSMPKHYEGFEATAQVSTDYEEIKNLLPGLVKSKDELIAEICDGYNDPIAQTFLVNGTSHPDGIFVDSVDICFASKPNWGSDSMPVFLELRDTVNGYPMAERHLGGALVKLYPEDVNVASGFSLLDNPLPNWEDPIEHDREPPTAEQTAKEEVSVPNFEQEYAYTRFKFNYPIYLKPGEYAIVVRSNDSLYKCWISDTRGEAVVDSGTLPNFDDTGYDNVTATVPQSAQYGGSFFRSQNGRTWSADQFQDLMFRINKCNFGGTALTPERGTFSIGGVRRTTDFNYDRLKINLFSHIIPNEEQSGYTATLNLQKSVDAEGTLTAAGGASGEIVGSAVESRTRDLSDTMTYYGDRDIKDSSIKLDFTLSSVNKDISPQIDTRNFYITPIQNNIDEGALRAENIKVSDGGSGYSVGNTFRVTGGGSTRPATFTIASGGVLGGGAIKKDGSAITITDGGANFHTSENLVVSEDTVDGSAAVFEVKSEEGTLGGNSKSRYVTRPINLAPGMAARAVRVHLTAQQPFGSQIYVYYKALAEEDSEDIKRKTWKLMKRTSPDEDYFAGLNSSFSGPGMPSGKTQEYTFDSDELITYTTSSGEVYDSFRTFAIKVVMFAQNKAQPPVLQDIRAIAVF